MVSVWSSSLWLMVNSSKTGSEMETASEDTRTFTSVKDAVLFYFILFFFLEVLRWKHRLFFFFIHLRGITPYCSILHVVPWRTELHPCSIPLGIVYEEVAIVHAVHYVLHPAVYHSAVSSIDNWQSFMFVCVSRSNEIKMYFVPLDWLIKATLSVKQRDCIDRELKSMAG